MQVNESIRVALASIRGNKLRTFLTLLSIAIGVFAITGGMTAVGSLSAQLDEQMAVLGSNTFMVRKFPAFIMGHAQWRKYMKRKNLTYDNVLELRERATLADGVGGQVSTSGITSKGGGKTTDPNVVLTGCDEVYLLNNNYNVEVGRGITAEDVHYGQDVAVIGRDIATRLWGTTSPIGQPIRVRTKEYTVVGLLASKGSTMGQSQDNMILLPISTFLKYFGDEQWTSLFITVRAPSHEAMERVMDQVTGVLRTLRKVEPWEENDFDIITNDAISSAFHSFADYIVYFAIGVSAISLLAAGIGIMNIMLVSVKERTREIGVRKAVGATRRNILVQFVIEAVTLCQLGGIAGILLGIVGGNLLSVSIDTPLYIPYLWMFLATLVCVAIGVLFGVYPAWKAAKLDPIEALRYE